MDYFPLLLITSRNVQTSKVLNDLGIKNIKDLILFKNFYPHIDQQVNKVKEFNISEDNYKSVLTEVNDFLSEFDKYSLTNQPTPKFRYLYIFVDKNSIKEQFNKNELNQCLSSGGIIQICGSKSTGKTILRFVE